MTTAGGASTWTEEQLRLLAEVRPRLVRLATKLARRFPVLDDADILGMAEDRVLSDLRRFDPSRGMSLYSFCFRSIMRDVVRAAYTRMNDPARTAWSAARRYAAGLEHPTLDERMNEGADDKQERAEGMGVDVALVTAFAYECHVAREAIRTPEDAAMAQEERGTLSDAVSALGTEKMTIMRLLYVEDASYEEAATTLQATVPQIKYSEGKVLAALRRRLGEPGRPVR